MISLADLHQTPLNVLVVDDHDVVRMGICGIIGQVSGVKVIGQAASGEQALGMARELRPDIVIMDIRMPGMGGIEATRRLLAANPGLKVIVVTMVDDDIRPAHLLKAGAVGYITKRTDREEMQRALQTILEGGVYVSAEIAQQLLASSFKPASTGSPFASLSQRELQIAQMIGSGHRCGEIAAVLSISPKTINTYKYRIFDKLGVGNDVELALAAVKARLVDPDEVL